MAQVRVSVISEQQESVFSYAMAVMEKFEGRKAEEKWWVPDSQHACGSLQKP